MRQSSNLAAVLEFYYSEYLWEISQADLEWHGWNAVTVRVMSYVTPPADNECEQAFAGL